MPPKTQKTITKSRLPTPKGYPITPVTTFPKFSFNMSSGVNGDSIVTQKEFDNLKKAFKKTKDDASTTYCKYLGEKQKKYQLREEVESIKKQLNESEKRKQEYLVNWRTTEVQLNASKRILDEIIKENSALEEKLNAYQNTENTVEANLKNRIDLLVLEIQSLEEIKSKREKEIQEQRDRQFHDLNLVTMYCKMERAALGQGDDITIASFLNESEPDEEPKTPKTCSFNGEEVFPADQIPLERSFSMFFANEKLDDDF